MSDNRDDNDIRGSKPTKKIKTNYTAPKDLMDEIRHSGDHEDAMSKRREN